MKWSFFSLLFLIVLASCQEREPMAPRSQVLRLNLSEDPVSLDPRVVRSLKDLTVVKQLFEGLMRLDCQGVPQPAIAQSVDISEDLLSYTFHLRDALWSNGETVTAHDFVEAWKSALSPQSTCDYAYMLYPLLNARAIREGKRAPEELGVQAVDKNTLIVQLEAPTPYFLELTAFPTYFPVHTNKEISNGPFCLRSWVLQSELNCVKNPHYWDSDAVKLDQLTFYVIPDNNTESQMFEKEEIDWLGQPISNNIAAELLEKMKREGKLDSYGIAGTLWFKFNTQQEPFDNLSIRKAFGYALNRAEIITHILQGNQMVATGPLPPCMNLPHAPFFSDGDVTEARKLFYKGLQEKGWTLETFPQITFNYAPPERNNKIAQAVQQQWQQALGITVHLQALERQLYIKNCKQGLFQIGIGDWIADFNDPLAILEIFKYKLDQKASTGINDTGWQNEEYITLLDASLKEIHPTARKELLLQAETLLMEAMPIAPLYHYSFDYIKKPYVQDVVLSPLGTADFKTARLVR